MATLDEQYDAGFDAGVTEGQKIEREAILAIATKLPRIQIEGCWHIDLDELERRIRQRGEEGK